MFRTLVFAVLLVCAAAAPTAASNLLTPQNFEQSIAEGVWFVEHFSPYCPHCRNFEPTWFDLVEHFEAMDDPGVTLAQVNCALNGDLCNQNGVTGYPQMNLYRDGKFVETYSADREFHLLVEFLNARAEHDELEEEEGQGEEDVPVSTEQEPAPTPTPTPTPTPAPAPVVVQNPRTDANPSGTVVSLDVRSFDAFLAQGPAFIKFFAPWCGHCKKLAPAWTQLGRRMQRKLNVAEVDCEEHRALCVSQGVTAFPMMFYYAHGAKTEYKGGRSYDQLLSFADKASNPTMQVIDASQLEQVVRDNEVLYLLLHDGSDPQLVDDVAQRSQFLLGSPPVYVTTSPQLFRTYKLQASAPSALLAFKDKDARDPISVFYPSTSPSPSALDTWLLVQRFPSSLELSKDVFQQVMSAPHHPLVLVVATPQGQHAAVSSKLHEIATKWRLRTRGTETPREVLFTWMDAGQWGPWLKDMYGLKVDSEPKLVVADHERLVYYDRDGTGHGITFNSISVASALEAVLAGTAKPRHSRNVLERGVYYANAMLVSLEAGIVAHPYFTACVVLGFVATVAFWIRSMFMDETFNWEAERRNAKRGRMD